MGYDTLEIIEAYRRKWEEDRARKENYRPPAYKCEHCRDTGLISIYPPNVHRAANGKIDTMMYCPYCRTEMLINVSGIMAEYRELDIARFPWETYRETDVTKLRQVIESFVYDFRKWQDEGVGLYIYSHTTGSGKTMAASAICSSICTKYNIAARFTKVEDFLADVKKTYDSRSKGELPKENVRKYFDTELLVLDDLGVSKINEWGQGVLHDLVNERYKTSKLCIVTSNYLLTELPVHSATKDRLNDMCLMLNFPEEPVRAHKAQERKNRILQHMADYDKFVDAAGETPFENGEPRK